MILHVILRSQDFETVPSFRFLEIIWVDLRFLGMLSSTGDLCESLSIFARLSDRGFRLKIQWAIPEKMAMFMAFTTTKGNMFKI